MNENGTFKKKKGFTIVGNSITRDPNLSLKAKGLYSLIASYITLDELTLSKGFIFSNCYEGEKAFESAWIELKKNGYLKVYMMPGSEKGWIIEYELLDEPRLDAHTYYLSKTGEITKTNLTIAEAKKGQCISLALPQKVGNAHHTPRKGSNANGSNGKGISENGVSNSNTINNTIDNTIINLSLNDKHNHKAVKLKETDEKEDSLLPITCCYEKEKLFELIKDLTDYDARVTFSEYKEDRAQFKLMIECIVEMVTEEKTVKYRGRDVERYDVLRKINEIINEDKYGDLNLFVYQTLDDFINGDSYSDIKDYKAYMKACIWNSFTTFKLRYKAEFKKKFYNNNNE